jgi:tRNA threonylcarbamoyladenosine biosynthesis protein TsaB
MRILAIETVGTTGSLALLDDERVVAERTLAGAQRSAQSLAPGIQRLLAEADCAAGDIALVAVANGPGSFTGLRIGVTTAKAFAYAVGCEVLGVDTMAAIAWRVGRKADAFSVIVDAQRGELFVADFTRSADGLPVVQGPTRVVDAKSWIDALAPGRIVTGPGLARWSARLKPDTVMLDKALWNPTAASVGQVALRDYGAGRRETVFDLVPQYLRRTAAEEQWEKKARNAS